MLIRDKLPEYHAQKGRDIEHCTLDKNAFRRRLMQEMHQRLTNLDDKAKRPTELPSLQAGHQPAFTDDLVQLFAFLEAFMFEQGVAPDKVYAELRKRRTEFGGYEKRLAFTEK
ncbi:MAG: hypothetical protein KC582_01360 [Candidatus Magasanikbacteria bacterium]|nr:hypothetical protein [Candidatus Magasanikbacteria bacterium]MCA9390883.1 hypothetical protein [Candidatus Magasanikbacteria bacterium]